MGYYNPQYNKPQTNYPPRNNYPASKTPAQMFDEKQKSINDAMDRKDIGATVGACLHDTIQIVLFRSKKTDSKEKMLKEITYWLSELRKIADKEKEPKKVSGDKLWSAKKQVIYEEDAELETINAEADIIIQEEIEK